MGITDEIGVDVGMDMVPRYMGVGGGGGGGGGGGNSI